MSAFRCRTGEPHMFVGSSVNCQTCGIHVANCYDWLLEAWNDTRADAVRKASYSDTANEILEAMVKLEEQ